MRAQIDSLEDPRVAVYRDLPGAKLTRDSGLFIAEGRLLVQRLVESRYAAHSLLVDERRVGMLPDKLPDVPVYSASAELIAQITGFEFHRGILACGYRQPLLTIDRACRDLPRVACVLACIDVQDPSNLGGILRSCAAFGVEAVLVNKNCADPFARRVMRVSMGGSLSLRIVESDDIASDLQSLRSEYGFKLAATVVGAATELNKTTRAQRTALLIGGEAEGLPEAIVQESDTRVAIPMSFQTDSLNASVAAGIFLYHFMRAA